MLLEEMAVYDRRLQYHSNISQDLETNIVSLEDGDYSITGD